MQIMRCGLVPVPPEFLDAMMRNDRQLRCVIVVSLAGKPGEVFYCTILCARAGKLDHMETIDGRVVHVYKPRIIAAWRTRIGDDRTRLCENDIVDCYGLEFTVYVDFANGTVAMELLKVPKREEYEVVHVKEEPGLVGGGPVIEVIQIL